MSITREGLVYLAVMGVILVAAVIRQINLLMLLYGVLAGPILLSWVVVRRTLKAIDVTRRAPATVSAGETFRVELTVANGKRSGSFSVGARDELKPRGEPTSRIVGAEVYFTYVPPRQSRQGSYQGVLDRRGLYDFQPIKIATRFPLGLLRTMLRIDRPQRLLVLPRLGRLSPQWRRLWKVDDDDVGGARRRGGLQEGDFYGLREWRAGDARSRIHWRTTARRQALTVRQYERKRKLSVSLIVDLWQPAKPTEQDRARLEEVVSFAATVAAEVCRESGRGLALEIVGKTTRSIRGTSSPQVLEDALKALATAEAATEDRLPAAVAKLFEQARPGGNVLVVGTRRNALVDRQRFAEAGESRDYPIWAARAAVLTPDDSLWPQMFQTESRP